MIDPYTVFEVHPLVADECLRASYMAKVRAAHPDKGGSVEETVRLTEAWALVSTRPARETTDKSLRFLRKFDRPTCTKCKGRGVVRQQKTFTSASEAICPACVGTGLP